MMTPEFLETASETAEVQKTLKSSGREQARWANGSHAGGLGKGASAVMKVSGMAGRTSRGLGLQY